MDEDTVYIAVIQGTEGIWMTHLIQHCNKVCFLIQVFGFLIRLWAKRVICRM